MIGPRTLADLINARKAASRMSLRAMSDRATKLRTPISPSTLSAYATGKRTARPRGATRAALANALNVPPDHIDAAAAAGYAVARPGPNLADGPHVQDWLLLIDGRPDAEISAALSVVRATFDMWDASKIEQSNRPATLPRRIHTSGATGG